MKIAVLVSLILYGLLAILFMWSFPAKAGPLDLTGPLCEWAHPADYCAAGRRWDAQHPEVTAMRRMQNNAPAPSYMPQQQRSVSCTQFMGTVTCNSY